jgi:hypothetical protein
MAADAADFAASLPELARLARRASQAVTEDGLKLHPDTVRALRRREGDARGWLLALAGGLVGLLLGLWW